MGDFTLVTETAGQPLVEVMAGIIHHDSRDWSDEASGSILHKVPLDQAREIAGDILTAARRYNIPLAYKMAYIRQESCFDPKARNMNLGRFPSRKAVYWDFGIAQLSGHNLIAMFSHLSQEEWIAQAESSAWAVDFMAKTYRTLLDWAKAKFPTSDPLYVATLAYNKGRTGATRIIHNTAPLAVSTAGRRHANSVMKHYRTYQKALRAEGML